MTYVPYSRVCGWCGHKGELALNLVCYDYCWDNEYIQSNLTSVLTEAADNQQTKIVRTQERRKLKPLPELKTAVVRAAKLTPEERVLRAKVYSKRYRDKHRLATRVQDYNKESRALIMRRRKERLGKLTVNNLTVKQWRAILKAYGYCCAYCGIRIPIQPTQDHVVPVFKNGAHTLGNVIPACKACNSEKRTKPADEFFDSLLDQLGYMDSYYKGLIQIA